MKADEVRLYALRGGLKKQAVCYTHFHSNKVFRGDLNKYDEMLLKAGCHLKLKSTSQSQKLPLFLQGWLLSRRITLNFEKAKLDTTCSIVIEW